MKAITMLHETKVKLEEQIKELNVELQEIEKCIVFLSGETTQTMPATKQQFLEADCERKGKYVVKFTLGGSRALNHYKSIKDCYKQNDIPLAYGTFCNQLSEGAVEVGHVKYKIVERF